ncbi:alpha/beta fold hydrolase [Ensifer canadensis]
MFRTALIAAALLIAGPALADSEPVGERVEVNGMKMYYEVSGEGEPLIVLHGAYMNIPSMGAIIPKLAETNKVYAIEFQGHGRTTDIDRPITYPNLADDVAAFMDAVGVKKADVFGYSMGAAAGLQLAIRHPDKVNKLAAASVGYDAEGWQPEFKAFIPQMTVEMFVGMPFAEDYRKLAANPDGFPALVAKLIALEKEPMAWEKDVKALKTPVLIDRRRCRCRDTGTYGGDVPAARRRRHGRHGQTAAGVAPRHPAGDIAHRRHQPSRAAGGFGRAFLQGRDRRRACSSRNHRQRASSFPGVAGWLVRAVMRAGIGRTFLTTPAFVRRR